MRANKRIYLAALLSAALVLFWSMRTSRLARRAEEKALGLAYFQGPLSDATMALTRSLPLFEGAEAPEYADAKVAIARSVASLRTLLATARPSQTQKDLGLSLPLLETLQAQIEAADVFDRGHLLKEIRLTAGKLVSLAEIIRYRAFNEWNLVDPQKLEMNALIYSLKEIQETLP